MKVGHVKNISIYFILTVMKAVKDISIPRKGLNDFTLFMVYLNLDEVPYQTLSLKIMNFNV